MAFNVKLRCWKRRRRQLLVLDQCMVCVCGQIDDSC